MHAQSMKEVDHSLKVSSECSYIELLVLIMLGHNLVSHVGKTHVALRFFDYVNFIVVHDVYILKQHHESSVRTPDLHACYVCGFG